MRVIVTAWGSGGDVLPFLTIGRELARRGRDVTFVGNPAFASAARAAGLTFVPAGTAAEYDAFTTDPGLWSWRHFATRLFDHWTRALDAYQDALLAAASAGPAVLVSHVLVAGARTTADALGMPLVTVALSPMLLGTPDAPAHPARPLPAWTRGLGPRGRRLAFRAIRAGGRLAGQPWASVTGRDRYTHRVTILRARAGLPPTDAWLLSTRRVIGAWPDWFAALGPDASPSAVLTGFVLPDTDTTDPRGLDALDRVRALDAPPVVFTTGTVASHEHAFYHAAVGACRRLGWPGVLIMPRTMRPPDALPDHVVRIEYAPFDRLLPHARALVHHGGIGTAAEALAAGIPQVMLPIAADHFDNAERVERLGVGVSVPRDRITAERLVRVLRQVTGSAGMADRCRAWQTRIERPAGRRHAADIIEAEALGAAG
jgi:rhamnosyltransferase subunit B